MKKKINTVVGTGSDEPVSPEANSDFPYSSVCLQCPHAFTSFCQPDCSLIPKRGKKRKMEYAINLRHLYDEMQNEYGEKNLPERISYDRFLQRLKSGDYTIVSSRYGEWLIMEEE